MGNRFEAPPSGEVGTDAELKDFLVQMFAKNDRTRALSPIDEIAANGGVTNTLGIRDAVVRTFVDEVKNRRLMSQ